MVQRIRHGIEGDHRVMVNAYGVNKAGAKFACEVTVSVIDLMNPGDLVFTVRNIERRREIMTSYKTRANAFALSQAALFACDAEGRIQEVNQAFLEMFGLSDEEEAKAKLFSDFMNDDPLPENFQFLLPVFQQLLLTFQFPLSILRSALCLLGCLFQSGAVDCQLVIFL